MESRHGRVLWLLGFMLLTALFCSAVAGGRPPRTFYAGGKNGWRLLPNDGLNRWAERKRFRVNDTIIFEYEKGKDSVMVVRKSEYYNCNKTRPIHHLIDGHSKIKFTRNGPFYFISGHAQNCLLGQKLHVVVMSPNHNSSQPLRPPPPPSPSPSPAAETPPPRPSDAPAPSPRPVSHSPSPSQILPPAPSPSPVSTPSELPPPPSSSAGEGWITALAPAPKSSGPKSSVISWGFTMINVVFLIFLV